LVDGKKMDRKSEEIRRRIRICMAAYAYEVQATSIISDTEFDNECKKVDVSISTGNDKMDAWFREEFDPCTGQWIHSHPDLDKLERLYETHYKP
jgi:hypothetical protein|tara:strand:+ start:318 stop:599 length:282 start_codon:yes stop_codon:yes gene_type:complete